MLAAIWPYRWFIGLALVGELVVGVLFYVWISSARSGSKPIVQGPVEVETPAGKVLYEKVDPIVVNPVGAGEMRTVILNLAFLLDAEPTVEELGLRRAQVYDGLIGVVSHKYVYELNGEENMEKLKEQLREAVNRVLRVGEVREVLILGMLIQ
ncbi:MAG: flagellar basal body-associated FliL family protein [bacterium]|nr:flagellar basal body-associated FliL family protein [bacterium]